MGQVVPLDFSFSIGYFCYGILSNNTNIQEPTTPDGRPNIQEFINLVKRKPANLHISILACTDEEEAIKYLDHLMDIPHVEVTEDYTAELKEMRKLLASFCRSCLEF